MSTDPKVMVVTKWILRVYSLAAEGYHTMLHVCFLIAPGPVRPHGPIAVWIVVRPLAAYMRASKPRRVASP